MIGQSETGSSSQIIFITLISGRCTLLLCHFLASANCVHLQEQNHVPYPKGTSFEFSSFNFNVQGDILSTAGVSSNPCTKRQPSCTCLASTLNNFNRFSLTLVGAS